MSCTIRYRAHGVRESLHTSSQTLSAPAARTTSEMHGAALLPTPDLNRQQRTETQQEAV